MARAGPPDRPLLADFLAGVRDREPGAVAVAEDWARALAYALVQIGRVIDPDRIVLGGVAGGALSAGGGAGGRAHPRDRRSRASRSPPSSADDAADRGSAFGAACMLHQRYLSLEGQRFIEPDPGAPGDQSSE